MKLAVPLTLIGPSFNSKQNPEEAVMAVDIQNVVAARPKKAESASVAKPAAVKTAPKDETKAGKAEKLEIEPKKMPENIKSKIDKTPSGVKDVKGLKEMAKTERGSYLQKILSSQELTLEEISEHAKKDGFLWSVPSIAPYLKAPNFVKTGDGKNSKYKYMS